MDNSTYEKNQPKIDESPQLASVESYSNNDSSYISNPFVIAFKGFSLLSKYAKGIFITMLILGFFGFMGSTGNFTQNTANSDDDEITTLISELETINENSEEATAEDIQTAFNISFNGDADEDFNIGAFLIAIAIIFVIIMTLGMLVGAAFTGVIAAAVVAASQEREISIGDAFSEMANRYWTLLKALILATLRVIGGTLLLVVPGIRASLRYAAVPYVVMMNPDMTSTEAVNESKKLYNGHLMESFGINFAGAVPIIGMILSSTGMGLSAKQLTEYDKVGLDTPDTHWLNYLAILLLAGLFVLDMLVAAAINS